MAQHGAQHQRGQLEVSFLNAGHLEVSIVVLNASFHLNSPWIIGIVGLNGQMFHSWRIQTGISVTGDQMLSAPESLPLSTVTFKVGTRVCVLPRRCLDSLVWHFVFSSFSFFYLLKMSTEMKSPAVACSLWARIRSIKSADGCLSQVPPRQPYPTPARPTSPVPVKLSGRRPTFRCTVNKHQHVFVNL